MKRSKVKRRAVPKRRFVASCTIGSHLTFNVEAIPRMRDEIVGLNATILSLRKSLSASEDLSRRYSFALEGIEHQLVAVGFRRRESSDLLNACERLLAYWNSGAGNMNPNSPTGRKILCDAIDKARGVKEGESA